MAIPISYRMEYFLLPMTQTVENLASFIYIAPFGILFLVHIYSYSLWLIV